MLSKVASRTRLPLSRIESEWIQPFRVGGNAPFSPRSPGQGACGSKRTTRGTNTGFSVNLESPSRYCMYGFSWIARMVFSSLKFSICFTIKAPTTMRAGLLPAPQWLFLRRLLCSFPILVQGRRSASLTQRLDLLNPERDSWS